MKLRTRLIVFVVTATAPLLAVVAMAQFSTRQQVIDALLIEFIATQTVDAQREACERDRASWTARVGVSMVGRPIALSVYDSEFAPGHANAEVLPAAFRTEMAKGHKYAGRRITRADEFHRQVIVPSPWPGGPCHYIVASRAIDPVPAHPVLGPPHVVRKPPILVFGAAALVPIIASLLMLGTVVARIRRLASEVQASAAVGYTGSIHTNGSDEVAALARTFDTTQKALRGHIERHEERERAVRSYMANATHDMRVPLSVLMGQLSRLREQIPTQDTAAAEGLAAAVEQAHYIGMLNQNMSSAARLAEGRPKLELRHVDLRSVVNRCVTRHRPLAQTRGLEFNAGLPELECWVRVDPTLVEQAVGNLIHNAIRYNETGSHVAVVLVDGTTSGTGQGFELSVLDDGPGIAPEQLSRVTQRGERGAWHLVEHREGQGLGLSIVTDVCAAMDWDLKFAALEPSGLCVKLTGGLADPACVRDGAGTPFDP